MITAICSIVTCNNQIEPFNFYTLIFLTAVLIGGFFLGSGQYRISQFILMLTSTYGVFILLLAFGPDAILEKYHIEYFFTLRLMTFISHSSATIVSIFLLFAASGKRFAHDSFLYIASGLGVLLINLSDILVRYVFKTKFSVHDFSGDSLIMTMLGVLSGLLLIMHSRRLAEHSPFRFRRSILPFAVFFVTLIAVLFLSFKLQRDEIDLLKSTQTLFVNSMHLAIKETVDNEVIPLNLLMNLNKNSLAKDRKDTTLEVARGVLFSRRVMQSLYWITPNGRLDWVLKKSDTDVTQPKLLQPASYYTTVTEQADVAIVTPNDFAKDNRVEIVVPYVSGGVIHAYIVAQLDFKRLLERAIDQVQFTRFDFGLFSESGLEISSNIRTVTYPGFSHKTAFDIFGKSFTVITAPSLGGLSEFITFLPKFTLIFGFFAALMFGHLFYVYSNLLISYDQVENLVRNRTVELEESRRTAEAASETKSLFLANISHEIRTPLNILAGVSEMLAETKLSKQQEQFVNMFKQSCTNLLRLVNDLLDMSKVESGKIELENVPFNLKTFIDEIVSLYRIKASEKAIQLVSNSEGLDHYYYWGDPLRLKQIIGNILINAIKFTDQGAVTLTVSNEDDRVYFRIMDTGIGIAKERITGIFERFEQIDKTVTRNYGGAGLGLAIAKDFVQLMHGQIDVQSVPGHGTVFIISVPLQKSDESEVLAATQSEQKIKSADLPKGLRVLITDDSADNRELVKVYLKNFGMEIEEAENGLVALDKIKSKKYDVVLMDMQMPVMDGYSAAQKIREFEDSTDAKRTAILALTAHALREDSQKCLTAGCDGYLSKPVSKAQLVEKLASLI